VSPEPTPRAGPRPRSPAQIEASRRNGARSKGPVTAEGKSRASRNAFRHGLCAEQLLAPGEDPAAFAALLAELTAEHAPESPSEALLVERLALTAWKLARADRLEARLATIEPRCPEGRLFPEPGLPRLLSRVPELSLLLRWQAQLDRQMHRLLKALAERPRSTGEAEADEPPPTAEGADAPTEPTAGAAGNLDPVSASPALAGAPDRAAAAEPCTRRVADELRNEPEQATSPRSGPNDGHSPAAGPERAAKSADEAAADAAHPSTFARSGASGPVPEPSRPRDAAARPVPSDGPVSNPVPPNEPEPAATHPRGSDTPAERAAPSATPSAELGRSPRSAPERDDAPRTPVPASGPAATASPSPTSWPDVAREKPALAAAMLDRFLANGDLRSAEALARALRRAEPKAAARPTGTAPTAGVARFDRPAERAPGSARDARPVHSLDCRDPRLVPDRPGSSPVGRPPTAVARNEPEPNRVGPAREADAASTAAPPATPAAAVPPAPVRWAEPPRTPERLARMRGDIPWWL
jgi:hypothetical protein